MTARRLPGFVPPETLESPWVGPFWRGLDEGRLLHQVCPDCDSAFFSPRPACPACLSLELDWEEMPARGTLASWTRIRRSAPGFETPYLLGLVDLEGGIGRLLAPLVGGDESSLEIGMPVTIEPEPTETGPTLWCVRLDRAVQSKPSP